MRKSIPNARRDAAASQRTPAGAVCWRIGVDASRGAGLIVALCVVAAASADAPLRRSESAASAGSSSRVASPERLQAIGRLRFDAQGRSNVAPEVLISEYELHEPTQSPRNQQYGGQVALSDDGGTLAVADIWYYGGSEWPWYGSGAVYVYARTNGAWTLEAKLEPPNARGYDFFGSDVALSADGDTLAVGAQYEGYDAPSQDAGPGSVFIFKRTNGVWEQEARLEAEVGLDGASFGRSIEISAAGDLVAVGAPYEASQSEGEEALEAGAVYIFNRGAQGWAAQAALRAPAPQAYDQFGLGVRLSDDGRTVAVLAAEQNWSTEDLVNGGWPNRSNTIYLFEWDGAAWLQLAEFEAAPDDVDFAGTSYEPEGQVEGFDLSGDGRTLAIASPFASGGDGGTGVVRFYTRSGETWTPAEALTPGLADRTMFGLRLTLSADANVLLAVAFRDEGPYGRPYVIRFERMGPNWRQAAALETTLWPQYTSFGDSLAISRDGQRAVVGSRVYATDESWWGAALVY